MPVVLSAAKDLHVQVKCGSFALLMTTAFSAVPFRTGPSFAIPFAPAISEDLLLNSLEPTASPALASELIAYGFQRSPD
jgi:hypothetical protein